ncbi:MAG: hypothetical protein COS95_03705 [Ignavibacteriales bacterium CG07_land_8_20_14_0_80_59_12]|nr:MAG: hypothetical protein COS95_03705 [Ignavibacteriales bacterium CG07_land_8_20_14_0_80_59_12]
MTVFRRMLLLSAMLPSLLVASGGGSPYSSLGLGDLRYLGGTAAAGMANTGIALLRPRSINALNPAGWARIERTRLDVGFLYEGYRTSDPNGRVFQSWGNFNGVLFAIPISESQGLAVAGGFLPFSTMNYNIESPTSLFGSTAKVRYFGDGGTSVGTIGFSYDLLKSLHFGARFNYVFGTAGQNTIIEFSDNHELAGGSIRKTTGAYGADFTFGAIFDDIPSIIPIEALKNASLGVVLTTPTTLNLSYESYYSYAQLKDTTAGVSASMDMPLAFGVGVSLPLGTRSFVAADYYMQPWSKSSPLLPSSPFSDLSRVSIGVERIASVDPTASYSERTELRGGAFYSTLYETVKGSTTHELGVSGGVGLPISTGTLLRLSAEYALRSSANGDLPKDSVFRIGLMLSASEKWFDRPEER